MKKTFKIIASIVVAVVVLFVGTVVALGLIKVKPMEKYFSGYASVEFYNIGSKESFPEIDFSDIGKSELGKSSERISGALKNTSFSVLNSIISGKADYKFSAAKDDEGELISYSADDIEALSATEDSYLLCLKYDEKKKIDAKAIKGYDSDILFDRVYLFITEVQNEVVTVRLIPVDYESVVSESDYDGDDAGTAVDREFYSAYELRLNIYAAQLYNDLKALATDIKILD